MKSKANRLLLPLFVGALVLAPIPGGALLGAGDQPLVFFLGGVPLSVSFERFLKPLPVPAATPGGGGTNQLTLDDTKGKETKKASSTLGPGSFTIVRRLDSASARLYEVCARGTHIPTTKWKNLVLKRGSISKYSVERTGGVAIETIEIAYESVEVTP